MSNSLSTDFTAFIDSRLNCFGEKLKELQDYKRQYDNINKLTQDLLAAMPAAFACTLEDINDSYSGIVSLSEQFSYRQGFRDAIRLFAEL